MPIAAPMMTTRRNRARSHAYGAANAIIRFAVPGFTFFFRTEESCPKEFSEPIMLLIDVFSACACAYVNSRTHSLDKLPLKTHNYGFESLLRKNLRFRSAGVVRRSREATAQPDAALKPGARKEGRRAVHRFANGPVSRSAYGFERFRNYFAVTREIQGCETCCFQLQDCIFIRRTGGGTPRGKP